MSFDPAWLDYGAYKLGRPLLSTDTYDDADWQAFASGWRLMDSAVQELATVGRRVLYGLSVGDTRPTWFEDKATLQTLVAQGVATDPPSSSYAGTQLVSFNAGWTYRHAEVSPIYTVGTDVLAGLSDGRALAADAIWVAERDKLREMLGV